MRLHSVVALAAMAVLGGSQIGFCQGFGNRMSATTSRIIQNMATGGPRVGGFGIGSACQPILPGGCYSGGGNTFPCYNVPIFFGYSGYSGYYGNYSNGYYDYGLAQENQLLRERLDRLEQQQAQAPAGADPPDVDDVPRKNANRVRVEKERADSAVKAGTKLFHKGSYPAAAQKFATAASLSPDDSGVSVYLAQSQFAAGQYAKAAQTLKRVLQGNPEWPRAEVDIRGMYGDAGDLVDQMGKLANHLKANPIDADAMFLLAFELFVTGEVDRSRKLFEQAARLSADDSHLEPFFDYFAARDGAPAPEPDDKADHGRKNDPGEIPVPDLLVAAGANHSDRK